MTARSRWLRARVARRMHIDITFKNSARRADARPKPTRVVFAIFKGEPVVADGGN